MMQVTFYASASGNEPARIWLKRLPKEDRKRIGEDIATVQYGWPNFVGSVKFLEVGLWEIRTYLKDRQARVIFTTVGRGDDLELMVLHGFIKKTRKTPKRDLDLARRRAKEAGYMGR